MTMWGGILLFLLLWGGGVFNVGGRIPSDACLCVGDKVGG